MVVTNKTKLKTFSASGGAAISIIEIKKNKKAVSIGTALFFIF
jgi:hypothetical protein